MRTYELLWALPSSTLTEGSLSDQIQSDAALVSRMIRNFPNDWAKGMFDFASICFPYFFGENNQINSNSIKILMDTIDAGKGMTPPSGITEVEISSELFPMDGITGSKKALTPAEYSTICKSMGIEADISEITFR